MGRTQLKIKNWPFEKGKKVQLIWIGEPFKYDNKWMIDTYFNDGETTKKVIQDWANIHFLSIDKYYIDGDLNSGEIIDKYGVMEIIDVDISNVIPKYNENDWRIKASNYKSKSRTFNFYKNNVLYSIPVVEIVRSVLAPNTFMLNTILYSDMFEDYFTYEINNRTLNLYFNNNYKSAYLKDNYYNHLAWIIGNKEILNMVNSIGYNASIVHKMIFNFSIPKFNFTARVKKNKVGYTVLEIIKVKEKEINFNELRVSHPKFEKYESSGKTKKWSYISLNNDSERILDNSVDGATKSTESIENELITHEYTIIPKVKKEKNRYINKRIAEDENTKKFIKEDDKRRTLADEGGNNVTKGIELSNVDLQNVDGELKEFIEVLNLLIKMDGIGSVEIKIAELPLGRKFSYLNDGITRRVCVIAKIISKSNYINTILEIQREGKALSTLIVASSNSYNLRNIYEIILKDLVRNSGKWNIERLDYLTQKGMIFKRLKHIKKDSIEVAKSLLKKLIY